MGRPKLEIADEKRQKPILTLRGTRAYKDWLDRFSAFNSAPLCVTLEQAISEKARKMGFETPPPRYKPDR